MRSYWELQCKGPTTGIVLKKFERVLQVKALDVKKERYMYYDNMKLERLDFFIEHQGQDWNSLLTEVLHQAGKITSQWVITIQAHERISGFYDPKFNERLGLASDLSIQSGLYAIFWEVAYNQQYRRIRLLGDKKNEW